jgi:hypothetical protein
VPVVIDQTADDDENVPDKFRDVQWTRLPAGDTPPEFVSRIVQLLAEVSPPLAEVVALNRRSGRRIGQPRPC